MYWTAQRHQIWSHIHDPEDSEEVLEATSTYYRDEGCWTRLFNGVPEFPYLERLQSIYNSSADILTGSSSH